jgi:hypothetical protein
MEKITNKDFTENKTDSTSTSRKWVFTWPNYTNENINELMKLTNKEINYIIFGEETCPTTNTKHLQGFIELIEPKKRKGVQKLLKNKGLHLEKVKARLDIYAINYCKKGEQSHEEWNKTKDKGINFGKNAIIHELSFKKQKKSYINNNKYEEMIKDIKENPNLDIIKDKYPELILRHLSSIKSLINDEITKNNKEKLKQHINKKMEILRPWQNQLFNEIYTFLLRTDEDRKIIWYYDKIGNSGKTLLSKYLCINMENEIICLSNGKSADISYLYKGEKIIIFDLSRSLEDMTNYSIIEKLKDGQIFSPKYESTTKIYISPMVIVFANFYPEIHKLSKDRWDIRILIDGTYAKKINVNENIESIEEEIHYNTEEDITSHSSCDMEQLKINEPKKLDPLMEFIFNTSNLNEKDYSFINE